MSYKTRGPFSDAVHDASSVDNAQREDFLVLGIMVLGSELDFELRWIWTVNKGNKGRRNTMGHGDFGCLEGDLCNFLCPFFLSPITLQALIQCGQPQCYTHILQWLRNEKANPLLIDVVTYLAALIPGPSVQRLQEIFNTAKEQQSRATFYALSHVIHK